MKKTVALLFLVATSAAAYLCLRTGKHVGGAHIAPEQTFVFLQLPDLHGSAGRWQSTAFCGLLKDPEIRACLNLPNEQLQVTLNRLRETDPAEAFIALTSAEGQKPKVLAGVCYQGKREHLERFASGLKSSQEISWNYAFSGDWCLAATDKALLNEAVQRLEKRSSALGNTELFKTTVAKMPSKHELLVFVDAQKGLQQLTQSLKASGAPMNPQEAQELSKLRALAATTAFEGSSLRDTIFVSGPDLPKTTSLQRHSLELCTADTLLYYAAILDPTSFWNKFSTRPAQELSAVFGPEMGLFLDWAPEESKPSLLMALDVRDPSKALEFLDSITIGDSPVLTRKADTAFYSIQTNTPFFRPVLTIKDRYLLAGLSQEDLEKFGSKSPNLSQTDGYKRACGWAPEPTTAFGYVDGRALVERTYGAIRPMLMMLAGLSPESSKFLKTSQLPSTEALGKHFGPIALSSWREKQGGWTTQSCGNVTFVQSTVVLAGGAAVLAFNYLKPLIERDLQNKRPPAPASISTAGSNTRSLAPEPAKEPQQQQDASDSQAHQ